MQPSLATAQERRVWLGPQQNLLKALSSPMNPVALIDLDVF
jgi:hypothetical protein